MIASSKVQLRADLDAVTAVVSYLTVALDPVGDEWLSAARLVGEPEFLLAHVRATGAGRGDVVLHPKTPHEHPASSPDGPSPLPRTSASRRQKRAAAVNTQRRRSVVVRWAAGVGIIVLVVLAGVVYQRATDAPKSPKTSQTTASLPGPRGGSDSSRSRAG